MRLIHFTFLAIGFLTFCQKEYFEATPDVDITVAIDAGHGGMDHGAKVMGRNEKELTLEWAFTVKEQLESYGINAVLIRKTDEFMSFQERLSVIKQNRPDFLISIHSHAKKGSAMEVYHCANSPFQEKSLAIAEMVASSLRQAGNERVSLREASLYVLKKSPCPGLMLQLPPTKNNQPKENLRNWSASLANELISRKEVGTALANR